MVDAHHNGFGGEVIDVMTYAYKGTVRQLKSSVLHKTPGKLTIWKG
jgi:hypothetical protein